MLTLGWSVTTTHALLCPALSVQVPPKHLLPAVVCGTWCRLHVYTRISAVLYSKCTSSLSFSVYSPQNAWELCLLELLCAWLPRHSTQSHSRDCSTARKDVIGGTPVKGIMLCSVGRTGSLATTAYLYLRGLTSLPNTLPGSIANAKANCIQ